MFFLISLLSLLTGRVSLHNGKVKEVNVNMLNAVDDYLDRLYEADRAFWAEGAWHNISQPEQWVELYHARVVEPSAHRNGAQDDPTTKITKATLDAENNHNSNSYSHILVKRDDPPFLYQAEQVEACQNAASTSIISGGKALDFASFAAGILTLVLNINNNINNNNNNNINLNINAVDSSNIVTNFNTNNANQVNIMPPGRRRKRSVVNSSAVALINLIRVALLLEMEKRGDCRLKKLCDMTTDRKRPLDRVLWRIFHEEQESVDPKRQFPMDPDLSTDRMDTCTRAQQDCPNTSNVFVSNI